MGFFKPFRSRAIYTCLSLLLAPKQLRRPLSLISASCTPAFRNLCYCWCYYWYYLNRKVFVGQKQQSFLQCVPTALAVGVVPHGMGGQWVVVSPSSVLGFTSCSCPISHWCLCRFWVPPCSPAPALAGGRCPPRRVPFILHSTAEASPLPSEIPHSRGAIRGEN